MEKISKNSLPWRGVILLAIAFFFIELIIVLFRYHTYYHTDTSYDQGIFNQVFWNGLQGRFFQSSLSADLSVSVPVPYVSYHRLGQHFTPSLLLWLPFYSLFPKASTLLVLNVTLITSGGIVLYILARQRLNNNLATWITAAYYCSGAVIGPTLGNFQDFCQIPLFGFGLFLALEKRVWIWFFVLSILLLAVREDAGIMLFSIGLYLIISKRYPALGIGLCIVSFVYVVIITTLVMPLFSLDVSQRFLLDEFGQYVDKSESSSSLEVFWGIFSNPLRLLVELFTPLGTTLGFIFGMFIPLALISWISGATWLLIVCPLFVLLLREGSWALSLDIRYSLSLIPGIFYGGVLWWVYHPKLEKSKFFKRFWATCLGLSILITVLGNPNDALSFMIPYSYRPWVYLSPQQMLQHSSRINSLLTQIPAEKSVTATGDIVPHLSSRREMLRFPNVELINDAKERVNVEYALVDLWKNIQFWAISRGDRRIFRENTTKIQTLLDLNLYGIVDYQEGVVLLKRDTPSNPTALSAWQNDPLLKIPQAN
jgi:uncharacterized membrane protein